MSVAARYSIERGIEGTKRIAFIGDEIEALVLLGRIDEAALLTRELERRGELLHRPTLSATAARCHGLVLGARGDSRAPSARPSGRSPYARDLGLPFERARALLVLGDIQRRAKQRGDARETLKAAGAAFDTLGASLWKEKATDSLARVGGRSAGRRADPDRAAGGDTRCAGPHEQGGGGRAVRDRPRGRGESVADLRQARGPVPHGTRQAALTHSGPRFARRKECGHPHFRTPIAPRMVGAASCRSVAAADLGRSVS